MAQPKYKFWITVSICILIGGGLQACDRSEDKNPKMIANNQAAQSRSGNPLQTSSSIDTHLIWASGIGNIRLGATLDEAKMALPDADFVRSTDGDGTALVQVKLGDENLMVLFANEPNRDAPIDWFRVITYIETFSPTCHTENGIHPGSLVLDVEKILGQTKDIIQSEIESREYIEFSNQPPQFTFRLDYTGIFPPNSRHTTQFDPKGKIHSVAVTPTH